MINKTVAALTLSALIAPSVIAQTAPTVAWDPPTEGGVPEVYNLYGAKFPDVLTTPELDASKLIGSTPATNFSLKLPARPVGTWSIAATAENQVGESPYSDKVSYVSLPLVGPPTNLRLESGTNYMFPLKLLWDKSSSSTVFGDVKYRVYRRNRFPADSTWFWVTETFSTSYSAQILQAGQYVFRVSTLKGNVESPTSSNDIFVRVGLAAKQEN